MEPEGKNTEQNEVNHLLASMGFIFPRTEEELDSFNVLYSDCDYELENFSLDPGKLIKESESKGKGLIAKKGDNGNRSSYFKRAVLAAEIATQLYTEPTFGHVKFQKLMFLCENIEGMNIDYSYSKQAAGPYDNRFMHSIEIELEKRKWFQVKKEKSGTFTKCVFIPLENFEGHKQYYKRYFVQNEEKIQWFIDTFRKEKTDKVELIATLYACWLELINKQQIVNETSLLTLLYSWSKEKQKYSEVTALKAIQWMKGNGVTPGKTN
jgi:hypothetical protein